MSAPPRKLSVGVPTPPALGKVWQALGYSLASMPRADYVCCKECGRSREEVGMLSCTRLCGDCAMRRLAENVVGIHAKRGPAFERRRYGIALREFGPRVALALKQAGVFDGALLDEAPERP